MVARGPLERENGRRAQPRAPLLVATGSREVCVERLDGFRGLDTVERGTHTLRRAMITLVRADPFHLESNATPA